MLVLVVNTLCKHLNNPPLHCDMLPPTLLDQEGRLIFSRGPFFVSPCVPWCCDLTCSMPTYTYTHPYLSTYIHAYVHDLLYIIFSCENMYNLVLSSAVNVSRAL